MRFDYIVVGAGAAGAPAAARLALSGNQVLLVEAGGHPNLFSKIPATAMAGLGSDMDWQYKTVSNNVSCLSSEDQQCHFARGKCLGGSTSINYMVYSRGNRKKDFQEITDSGWTFDDLMPYLLRYEGLQCLKQLPTSSVPYHNTTGIMRLGFFDDPKIPWHSILFNSFRSLQIPENKDVNAESQIGVSKFLGYVYKGERMSTARAYLAREDVKKVLKVAMNTMCTGVIINNKNIARGVTVVQGLKTYKLFARKEVILSAGAVGTPQILMLSGIGPANHLRSMGIPLKVDLPVGDGMTDHVLSFLIVKVDSNFNEWKWLAQTSSHVLELLVDGRGPLTSHGVSDINTFINTHCYDFELRRLLNESFDGSDCEVPNIHIISVYVERYMLLLSKELFKKASNYKDAVLDQLFELNEQYAFIMMCPILLEPRSSGNVRLESRDPLTRPYIYPNYLGDQGDVNELVRANLIVQQLIETHELKEHNASLLYFNLPGCPRHEEDFEAYWKCYVRHLTGSVYHAAGTTAIGRVLDGRLRVRGVTRLRVADLGVLPRSPRATPAAVTIAIGERVVDFVLQDNK